MEPSGQEVKPNPGCPHCGRTMHLHPRKSEPFLLCDHCDFAVDQNILTIPEVRSYLGMSDTQPTAQLNVHNPKNSMSHLGCLLFLQFACNTQFSGSKEAQQGVLSAVHLLTTDIHQRNVDAGWWTDLKTGESIIATRNFGEMLMLMVTELREAEQGRISGEPDDKVPNFPMHTVEIADAQIRAFDFCGARCPGLDTMIVENLSSGTVYPNTLFQGMIHLADAMEAFRKNRIRGGTMHMAWFLIWSFRYAQANNMKLADAFVAKLAYNTSREDHKIANRIKPDGKLV